MTNQAYTTKPFPLYRHFVTDWLELASHKHTIHGLIEPDITKPRARIREIKQATGGSISFTSFIIYCCARAVEENRLVHAYRDWRNRLILFDDVDVAVPVEISAEGPVPQAIIRAANRKSIRDISQEIRLSQSKTINANAYKRGVQVYAAIPAFLRRSFYRAMYLSPHLVKKYIGTVMVSSVGMFGSGAGWGIPPLGHPLCITVGGIISRPWIENGQLESREHVCLTISFDHDVIDGAPAARFIRCFEELVEHGEGLFEGQGVR